MIDRYQYNGTAKENHIEKRNQVHGHRLRRGERIKAKGSWQTMECDEKAGS